MTESSSTDSTEKQSSQTSLSFILLTYLSLIGLFFGVVGGIANTQLSSFAPPLWGYIAAIVGLAGGSAFWLLLEYIEYLGYRPEKGAPLLGAFAAFFLPIVLIAGTINASFTVVEEGEYIHVENGPNVDPKLSIAVFSWSDLIKDGTIREKAHVHTFKSEGVAITLATDTTMAAAEQWYNNQMTRRSIERVVNTALTDVQNIEASSLQVFSALGDSLVKEVSPYGMRHAKVVVSSSRK